MIRDYHVFLALNKGYIDEEEELLAGSILAKGIKMTELEISMYIAKKNKQTNAREYKNMIFNKDDVDLFILEGRVIHESKSGQDQELFFDDNNGGGANGFDNEQ